MKLNLSRLGFFHFKITNAQIYQIESVWSHCADYLEKSILLLRNNLNPNLGPSRSYYWKHSLVDLCFFPSLPLLDHVCPRYQVRSSHYLTFTRLLVIFHCLGANLLPPCIWSPYSSFILPWCLLIIHLLSLRRETWAAHLCLPFLVGLIILFPLWLILTTIPNHIRPCEESGHIFADFCFWLPSRSFLLPWCPLCRSNSPLVASKTIDIGSLTVRFYSLGVHSVALIVHLGPLR